MNVKELTLKLVERLAHSEYGPDEEVMISVARLNVEGVVISVRNVPIKYIITELQATVLIAISEDDLNKAYLK